MRKEAYIALMGVLLVWIQFGCQPTEHSSIPNDRNSPAEYIHPEDRTLLMGSFNIRQFGVTKLAKTDVMETLVDICLLYTSPSPRDRTRSRMPSSA